LEKKFHGINATLENREADHKYAIVEIEGIISNRMISILIYLGDTLSYITPKRVEDFQFTKVRHAKP